MNLGQRLALNLRHYDELYRRNEPALTIAQYMVLKGVEEKPSNRHELAKRDDMGMDAETIGMLLRRLKYRRMIIRVPKGRIRRATITKKGVAALRVCERAFGIADVEFLSGISPEFRGSFFSAIYRPLVSR